MDGWKEMSYNKYKSVSQQQRLRNEASDIYINNSDYDEIYIDTFEEEINFEE
jgi:hypothetical protein